VRSHASRGRHRGLRCGQSGGLCGKNTLTRGGDVARQLRRRVHLPEDPLDDGRHGDRAYRRWGGGGVGGPGADGWGAGRQRTPGSGAGEAGMLLEGVLPLVGATSAVHTITHMLSLQLLPRELLVNLA
jgi:hypothetical protein